jgi:parallel beta-helix repeat protein
VLTQGSDFNYVALNSVASSGYADGRTVGAGIWLNNESDGNTVNANAVSGDAECGIDVFVSSNNIISSNDVWDNYEGGIFIFDGTDYPAAVGNIPTNTLITNNFIHANKTNGGVTLAGAINTTIENNFISGAYTGVVGSSSEVGLQSQRTTNTQFINNSVVSVSAGVYIYSTTTGLSLYRNRFINEGTNYCFTGATAAFDDSVTIGGNYWGDHPTTSPYTRFIFGSTSTLGGGNVDNYPFATEALNQSYAVNVTAPVAGTSVADFSKRVIQWTSTGSSLVDIYYTSSETGSVLIASNRGDTGSYVWSVPNLAAYSDYQIKIVPKNIFGQVEGSAGLSGQFAVTSSSGLQLLAPGDSQTLTPGSTTTVAWSSVTASTSVDVQLQTNGGSWTTLASGATDDWATVTIPSTITNAARIRVVLHGTSTGDEQDGTFRITNFGGVYALSNQLIGSTGTINWLSPTGTTTVNVQYWNGLAWQPIVSDMPDAGHLNWFVPEMATNGALVQVQFNNASGGSIGSAVGNPFNIQYTLATGTLVNCYRAYNPNNHAQLFTSDPVEYNSLGAGGWQLLGARYKVYNAPITINGVAAVPNYRLYDPTTQQHFWTTSREAYFALRNNGTWIPLGVSNYEFNTQVAGSIPLYRSALGGPPLIELWTVDLIEYNSLPGGGWTNEGIDAYVLPVSS